MSSRREFDRYTGAAFFQALTEMRFGQLAFIEKRFHRDTLCCERRSTTENSSDYLIKMWVDLFLEWNLLNRSAESSGRRSWSPKRGTKPTNGENYGAGGSFDNWNEIA